MSLAPVLVPDVTSGGDGPGPRHVAIIMDGNGRWAKRRFLPRIAGHRQGVEAVRRVVRAAPDLGVEVLTLYAFSSENWRRPADEVSDLMGLLRTYLISEIDELDAKGVRLRLIGDWRALRPDLVELLEQSVARTALNSRMTLAIALNYGAQVEIARACAVLAEDVLAGRLEPGAITADLVGARLDSGELPPLDLLIRTSGELRLSNFLLWQAAYAELLFTDRLWPDFDGAALAEACLDYRARERRFGGL